jgi:uncharacterized protein (TIGR00255 family)
MSVYSMTGYASASAGTGNPSETAPGGDTPAPRSASAASTTVTVELRSVNSRFLDLAFRMPDELRSIEPAMRDLLVTALRRGKIELRLASKTESDSTWPQPQPEQLMRLTRLESTVQGWLPKAQSLTVNEVMHWCKSGTATERLDEVVLQACREAIAGLLESREREGARLVSILMERVVGLRALADRAEPLVPLVVAKQQQRFLERWQEALDASNASQSVPREALQERAINEAAAFAIRIDVAEELARLRAHLDEIARLLKKGGEVGKRLDFLIQELLREANTLASKAASLELTNVSVEMKVLIEQLREQVQNLE